ncbi:MAG: hypothetical protein IH629_06430, partial [Thermoleophilia bacterium]|nr:hypothetical protein [Thermoleophilia bacterium]
TEHFDARRWEDAAAATGIPLGEPVVARPYWRDAVDARLSPEFFEDELARAREGELTEDCRDGVCAACGVCGGEIGMELLT